MTNGLRRGRDTAAGQEVEQSTGQVQNSDIEYCGTVDTVVDLSNGSLNSVTDTGLDTDTKSNIGNDLGTDGKTTGLVWNARVGTAGDSSLGGSSLESKTTRSRSDRRKGDSTDRNFGDEGHVSRV